ncbi:MAG: hypothetical protein FJ102_06585 [Deltaproteobacteria bacterium]|nr:hypothetical protein [Deltaproteobacteria bacterium]
MLLWTALLLADVPIEAWARPVDVSSARVREAAEQLALGAESVASAGRLERLAELHTDAAELRTRAAQLEAAAAREP